MLAEIYMLRLEAAARAAKDVATSSRFVPITLRGRRERRHHSFEIPAARRNFVRRSN
jgi:hypothetical protein